MLSNGDFVLNVSKKVLNLQTKDQVDVLAQNYSLLSVWSVAIPIVLLSKTVIVVARVAVANLIVSDT